jgi:hypothetical protein
MSYRWPNKDKDEQLDYSVDWSRWLGDGVTISVVNWFVDDSAGVKTAFTPTSIVNGLQNIANTNTTTVATINLALGTNNVEYKLHCRITDSSGSIAERTIKLRIKEQ